MPALSEDDLSVTVPSVLLVVEGDQYQSVSMIRRSLDSQRHVIVFKVSSSSLVRFLGPYLCQTFTLHHYTLIVLYQI